MLWRPLVPSERGCNFSLIPVPQTGHVKSDSNPQKWALLHALAAPYPS